MEGQESGHFEVTQCHLIISCHSQSKLLVSAHDSNIETVSVIQRHYTGELSPTMVHKNGVDNTVRLQMSNTSSTLNPNDTACLLFEECEAFQKSDLACDKNSSKLS